MTFTLHALIAANAALERAAGPLLKAWDDLVWHSDQLACLLDRDDRSDRAEGIRKLRIGLSELATAAEHLMEAMRLHVAEAHQVEVEHMVTVAALLKSGDRS